MKVKIWGCRGSLPAPLRPRQIEEKIIEALTLLPDGLDTSNLAAVEAYVLGLDVLDRGTAGGNTTCVEIEAGGHIFVVDAGTGIRELGRELMKGPFGEGRGEIHLFFSHPHWDHIQGFPFFTPAYIPGNRIFIYSHHDLEKALVEQQHALTFPVPMSTMSAAIKFTRLAEDSLINVGDVQISTIRNAHPGDSFGYRFEDGRNVFVFASDSEYKVLANGSVQPYLAFFKNADALIFDAQYTLNEGWLKEDWGHSSAMIGVDMALTAGVKRLILFHHDPEHDDQMLNEVCSAALAYRDEIAEPGALEILIAYEGLSVDLNAHDRVIFNKRKRSGAPILVSKKVFDEASVERVAESLVVFGKDVSSKSRIIDLSHVETLTTASLKQLVQLQHSEDSMPLILAAPSPSAMRVIELGGFSDFFAIYPTVEAAQAAVTARESAQVPGQFLGDRYLIERVLADRLMGIVLGAKDQKQGIEVAVRIIDPAFSAESLDRLFAYEDRLLAADHPNLLRIYELSRDENSAFIVEEFHGGQTLESYLKAFPGGLPLSRGIAIAQEIAAGLAYAHSQDIVHSNLGLDKIFIDERGLKIGGMALGRLEGKFNLMEVPLLRQNVSFLAPEQILAQPINSTTDLYAFGIILYKMFTGRLPFRGYEREVLKAHLLISPIPPKEINNQIPGMVDRLISKLLAKLPENRFSSMTAVQEIFAAIDA